MLCWINMDLLCDAWRGDKATEEGGWQNTPSRGSIPSLASSLQRTSRRKILRGTFFNFFIYFFSNFRSSNSKFRKVENCENYSLCEKKGDVARWRARTSLSPESKALKRENSENSPKIFTPDASSKPRSVSTNKANARDRRRSQTWYMVK